MWISRPRWRRCLESQPRFCALAEGLHRVPRARRGDDGGGSPKGPGEGPEPGGRGHVHLHEKVLQSAANRESQGRVDTMCTAAPGDEVLQLHGFWVTMHLAAKDPTARTCADGVRKKAIRPRSVAKPLSACCVPQAVMTIRQVVVSVRPLIRRGSDEGPKY